MLYFFHGLAVDVRTEKPARGEKEILTGHCYVRSTCECHRTVGLQDSEPRRCDTNTGVCRQLINNYRARSLLCFAGGNCSANNQYTGPSSNWQHPPVWFSGWPTASTARLGARCAAQAARDAGQEIATLRRRQPGTKDRTPRLYIK